MASEVGSVVFRTAVPSLAKLLKYEWGLHKTVKHGLTSLEAELRSMQALLENVSSVPADELDQQVKIWAGEVRDLSYTIEKRLHSFMARIESTKKGRLSRASFFINHEIASFVKEIMIKVKEVSGRRTRYSDDTCSESTSTHKVDPRIFALYTEESDLVGLAGATDELTKMLLSKDDHVSILGMGGLGKTTLARAVSKKMKNESEISTFFVSVGRSTDVKKVLKDILHQLKTEIYYDAPDEKQLIDLLRNSLDGKRCLFVIDDIWDKQTWDLLNCAFKGNGNCKIITTTRKLEVAEEVGGIYKMKPLSDADSKKLLHTKIFGAEAKSYDTEFEALYDKFLRKCSGVPIAIIMIASFLAKKPREEWSKVYESIGFHEHEGGVVKDIRMIMSFSYYDLPYYLRRCFLYLSLFPEDHWIEKNMLIWRWVAEGLVSDPNEQRSGLFELGETYFNELIDRSMIQRAISPHDLGQGGCRVHDLMLDLIRDLSSSKNENFSAVRIGMKQESISQTRPIHRLAIHETNMGQIENTRLEVGEVLSLYANNCCGSAFPRLSRFAFLRVIDLVDCDLSAGDCKLKDLGKLGYVEYIGLLGTPLAELPKNIGHLKFLQTLDVTATGIEELPSFVEKLGKLRCLRASKGTRMMGRVGNLTSLEELWLHSADKSPDFAAELQKLTKMRVLVIHFDKMDEELHKVLVESLGVLKKLQILQIWSHAEGNVLLGVGGWEGDEAPPFPEIRQLLLFGIILRRPMPWINPLCSPKLCKLLMQVKFLKAQDLEILGRMPSLRSLYLHSSSNNNYPLSYTAGRDEFKVLEYLNTNIELVCGDGGLPMIQELEVGGIRVGTDVGLRGNMPVLDKASYHLDCGGCTLVEIEKAETALAQASQDHPKRPTLSIKRFNNLYAGFDIELQLSELMRELGGGGSSSSEASSPDILSTVSHSIARFLPTIKSPPTLTIGDTTDGTGSSTQFAGDQVLPRRPNGEGQVLLTARPRFQIPQGKFQISTENWLEALSSESAACSAINWAVQTGMDPAVVINIYERLAHNPEFIAATNNLERDANGFMSASHISTTLPLIMQEMISQAGEPGRGSGTYARAAAASEGLGDKSFEFEVLDSFESMIADDAVLASIGRQLAHNAVPGITTKDVVAEARNLTKKFLQNHEVVACLKSMQNAGASGPSAHDECKLRKVMADCMRNMDRETDGPGRSQGAEANLTGRHRAENCGAGTDPEPTPPQVDNVFSWVNILDRAEGMRDESFKFKVLESFESVITDNAVLARVDSSMADEYEVPGITAKDAAAYAREFMKKSMENPEVVACLKSGPSPSNMFKLRRMLAAELMSYTDQVSDEPGRSQGAEANLAGKHPAENSGAGAGPEATPKVPCMHPQAEGNQEGENVSRMLKKVLPAVEQALAARASSGQPLKSCTMPRRRHE